MNSSMYLIIGILTVAAIIAAIAGIWNHKTIMALTSFALALLGGGILLNIAGLRHEAIDGARYGWATLPEVAYSAPLMIATILLGLAGLMKLSNLRRNRRNQRVAAKVVDDQSVKEAAVVR